MNESQTRLDKIDPKLKASKWSIEVDSKIITEFPITLGKISQTVKTRPKKADYILSYKNVKLAVVEAKADEKDVSEGVMQAKEYAERLQIRYTYATNGDKIYEIDMLSGEEGEIDAFPKPQELWYRTFGDVDEWRDQFNEQTFYNDGQRVPRYYQENAINSVLWEIAKGKTRLLLTLATGTGKTFIAFQIAYKLFHTKWNVKKTNNRPRILFLADRNILANQAFNSFSGFANDALVRIKPGSIKKNGGVPTNGSIFFTIFQTFMSGDEGYFGDYPKDFFDFIIIDECHRGGAKNESNWHKVMEYFDSAVQLGMTATPRRDNNVNTYRYFCSQTNNKPVYEYSLKQGINDGYLTPFRHVRMSSNIDDYIYNPEDEVISGEVEQNKVYYENDFYNGNIIIKQRDEARVKEFMQYFVADEKTIVFCATQNHAGQIRDMINAYRHGNPKFAVRVTANDGELGETYLKEFQDNEKTIPTVLTTSQKLSTGVDALNVRNIVLLRPVNSMIEFKQIIGRGTRLFDGKYYFTIYDFVKAYEHFSDPEWDGEPEAPAEKNPRPYPKLEEEEDTEDDGGTVANDNHPTEKVPLVIKLSDGRTRKISFVRDEMFWGADGSPISAVQFLQEMFGKMPDFFTSKEDLQQRWANPNTREVLLNKMASEGYGIDILNQIRSLIDADNSDILDVLEYIAYNTTPIERAKRVERVVAYADTLATAHKDFVYYIITAYVKEGINELKTDRLPELLSLKFGSIPEGINALGSVVEAQKTFLDFQQRLYK